MKLIDVRRLSPPWATLFPTKAGWFDPSGLMLYTCGKSSRKDLHVPMGQAGRLDDTLLSPAL